MKPSRTSGRAATQLKSDSAKRNFARAITRAEFGRFYWNDELADEVKRACLENEKRPKRN